MDIEQIGRFSVRMLLLYAALHIVRQGRTHNWDDPERNTKSTMETVQESSTSIRSIVEASVPVTFFHS